MHLLSRISVFQFEALMDEFKVSNTGYRVC